ncbi:MAG: glyoxalase [Flavobacteriaceae bacterium]
MIDRPNDLLRMRPQIKKIQSFKTMSLEERFQNETLRPILKFQNLLLIEVFRSYIDQRKGVFYNLNLEKKLLYIENALLKDQRFRSSIKGMIVGLLTIEEYADYIRNSSSLNKRMINLVTERLKDQVQLFDPSLKKVV